MLVSIGINTAPIVMRKEHPIIIKTTHYYEHTTLDEEELKSLIIASKLKRLVWIIFKHECTIHRPVVLYTQSQER